MDILNQGPYSVAEALQLGLVDGLGYHQELLAEFREIGIKTWSLRKYCDAAIVQTIFSDIDMSRSIIPQLLRNKDKAKKKEEAKQGKAAKKGIVGIEVSLFTEKANPTIDDAALKVEIVVPRNIGLIYLDTEITGYNNLLHQLMAAKENSAVKRRQRISLKQRKIRPFIPLSLESTVQAVTLSQAIQSGELSWQQGVRNRSSHPSAMSLLQVVITLPRPPTRFSPTSIQSQVPLVSSLDGL